MPTLSQAGAAFKDSHARSNWRADAWAAALLLLPFLLVGHWLQDLHAAILTFHGTDELIFHYPAIVQFAGQWPEPVLDDYTSATTPLFHLLFSLLGKLLGFDLYKLRAVNVLISFCAGFVYFRLLKDHFRHSWAFSLLMSLAFLLSPYFFGVSFLLLTDNLAWLLCMLALSCFLASLRLRRARMVVWALGCGFLCLTLLTRQSFAWLLLSAAAMAWFDKTAGMPDRLIRLALLGAAAMPLASLVIAWGGLMPPSFQEIHEAHSLLNPRAPGFTLAVLGLYGVLFNPDRVLAVCKRPGMASLAALAAGLFLVSVLPMPGQVIDDGFLWRLSHMLPLLHGTSLLFWVLVPLGCVVALTMLLDAPLGVGTLSLLAFALSVLPSQLLFQKYFDPFIPVFIVLARGRQQRLSRLEGLTLGATGIAFMAYAALPYAHPGFLR